MTGFDRLERDLAVWFEDTALPNVPDYVDDIVREAVRGRQRPRWSFIGRWLPVPVSAIRLRSLPIQWRALAMLVLLVLVLAAVAALIGSRQRVPPPFGPAQNGLVVFARGGDIFTFDPVSRIEAPLLAVPQTDQDPAWSLDGTRYAFVRQAASRSFVGFADRDGGRQILSDAFLKVIDTDSVAWSPDGRGVTALAGHSYYFINATTGAAEELPLDFPDQEIFFRPPDGREFVYRSANPREPGLLLYSLEDRTSTMLVSDRGPQARPRGWSPDGERFVYHTTDATDRPLKTYVLDLQTNHSIPIEAAAGRLSNDGTRVAGLRYIGGVGWLCVAPAAGGPCSLVGDRPHDSDVTHGDALNWSPDDEWLIVFPLAGREVILIDADGNEEDIVIPADGAASWQRLARP